MKYTVVLEFDLTNEQFEFLKKLSESGYAEYRDTEYTTLQNFQRGKLDKYLYNDEWFLRRNFGGTYYLIEDLLEMGLIMPNQDAWHDTYHLSEIGKKLFITNDTH